MRLAPLRSMALAASALSLCGFIYAQNETSSSVEGGGISAPGWMGKVDANAEKAGQSVKDAKLSEEGGALHITTGPAITYWNPANKASGKYTGKATFKEPKYMNLNTHPHPYGIVIAGNDLGTPQQSYLYCAAYGNGNFIVRGFGPEPFQMNGKRGESNAAVHKASGPGEPVTQEIAMSVKGDKVDCAINGTVVATYEKSALVGQGIAFFFILAGLYRFFVGANFGGLWMAFIGWFLLDAARSSYLQVGMVTGLRGHRVGELMEKDCANVPGYLSVRDFVDEYLLRSGQRCFVVMQNSHAAGIATAEDARAVSRDRWAQTSLQGIMRPLNRMVTVSPDLPVVKALELMSRERVNELAVVSNGKFEGVFTRSQVLRFLQMYSGMGHSHDAAA